MTPIQFRASVFSVRTDRDGEGRVVLSIPLSDLGAALVLATCVDKVLVVTVEQAGESTS